MLLGYLKSWFGLGGTVLKWFASYLSDCCQTIKIGSTLSELSKLIYGIPQGSVLGPLLFSLYTTPLSKIIRLHPHTKFHFYVDNTQLYIHLSHKNVSASLAKLNACLHDVQRWMYHWPFRMGQINLMAISKPPWPFCNHLTGF